MSAWLEAFQAYFLSVKSIFLSRCSGTCDNEVTVVVLSSVDSLARPTKKSDSIFLSIPGFTTVNTVGNFYFKQVYLGEVRQT